MGKAGKSGRRRTGDPVRITCFTGTGFVKSKTSRQTLFKRLSNRRVRLTGMCRHFATRHTFSEKKKTRKQFRLEVTEHSIRIAEFQTAHLFSTYCYRSPRGVRAEKSIDLGNEQIINVPVLSTLMRPFSSNSCAEFKTRHKPFV